MKTSKKLLALALALIMVFACSVSVFALTSVTDGTAGSYIQGTPPTVTGTFTVYLSIQGGKYNGYGPINRRIAVSMGSANASSQYTVYDVLVAAHNQYSYLSFDMTPNNYHSSYLNGIMDTGITSSYFSGLPLKIGTTTYYAGWMFRINGKIPMLDSTNGALIGNAYVNKNDIIDLYYANVYDQSYSTKAAAVEFMEELSDGRKRIRVLASDCYIPTGGSNWSITGFSPLASTYVKIKVGTTTYSGTTSVNGTLLLPSSISGTYSVQVVTTYYDDFTYSNIEYDVPEYVGLYCILTF